MFVRGDDERLRHLAEDVHPAGARLLERLRHDLRRDAGDLDVHLQRGDALRRAGDLEVHVAVVILGARDVREDGPLAALLVHDEPHRDARDRRLDRHAGVHHRHRAAADRRHRRRAVRLEDVGDEPDGVGELVVAGNDRRERALRQRAVADLAASGAGETAGLADRERREVVVEHEALVELAADVLDLLLVVRGAERAGDERLRLAAREDDRAVDARAARSASVQIGRIWSNLRPSRRCPLLRTSSRSTCSWSSWKMCLRLGVLLDVERVEQIVQNAVDLAVAFQLVENPHRVAERAERLLMDGLVELRGRPLWP